MDLLVLKKKIYGKLTETMDLTKQIAESVDRRDQVSVQMLVSMREGPIAELAQTRENLQWKEDSLSAEDRLRLAELLHGTPPSQDLERTLAEQEVTNGRLLERVVALDRNVSRKLGGEDSYYAEE